MARNRIGPGSFRTFIVGAIGILFWGTVGVLIAAVFLIMKPVNEVKRMPEEDDIRPGVYYIEGKRSGIDGAGWVAKRNELVSELPFEFALNEQEFNQWSSLTFGERRKELMVEYGDAKIEPGIPLFRIADDILQVGIPVEISGVGENRRIILQATGTFVEEKDRGYQFQPDKVYLGSCRVPNFRGISSRVVSGLTELMSIPEDVRTAWPTVTSAQVEGDVVKLQRL
jgi:hypothetical protein